MNTNPKAKRILCFGDSNTWGYIPGTNYDRYSADVRWTGILQEKLGRDYEVIEDGVNSRTIVAVDKRPGKESRLCKEYIKQCFFANEPLDLFIVFMGTNEMKTQFGFTVQEITDILLDLFVQVTSFTTQKDNTHPKLLVIVPPPINDQIEYAQTRFNDGKNRSFKVAALLKENLEKSKIDYIDGFDEADIGMDGLHLTKQGHKKLGERVSQYILLHK